VATAVLPRLDELAALERALECYLDQYLCLLAASPIARHYVREQLDGGTWALRADVLGAECFGEMREILAGEGMGGDFVRQARELPERWVPQDPEGMVRALVVRAIRTKGEIDQARDRG
jgi:hypothetical protein